MKKTENQSRELMGHIVGILICAAVIQIAELVFVWAFPVLSETRLPFARGFWIGTVTAVVMAVHMDHAIDRALGMEEKRAERYMSFVYLMRTFLMLAVAGMVQWFKIGYVMAVFLGMLCLQFADMRKVFRKEE